MENMINIDMVNELLDNLGYQNILVTNKPIFYWNGNTVTNDETAPVKQVSSYKLNENFNFFDFISKNKDKKIIICSTPSGKLISENNEIRAFIA